MWRLAAISVVCLFVASSVGSGLELNSGKEAYDIPGDDTRGDRPPFIEKRCSQYLRDRINEIEFVIQNLPDADFSPPADERKDSLFNKLEAVFSMSTNGRYRGTVLKLLNDIRSKMDGSQGGDPGDDWIINPDAQAILAPLIDMLIEGDFDADGLTWNEENDWGTDYCDADTDNDGIPDGDEVEMGTDPRVDDGSLDPDGDGLTNKEEWEHGTYPHDPDSDNDFLNDFEEVMLFSTDPMNDDTDGDGLVDGEEGRLDHFWHEAEDMNLVLGATLQADSLAVNNITVNLTVTGSVETTDLEEAHPTLPLSEDVPNGTFRLGARVRLTEKPTLIEVRDPSADSVLGSLPGSLTAADWNPYGSKVVAVGTRNTIVVFDGFDTQFIFSPGTSGVDWQDVSWRPDGTEALVVGSEGRILRLKSKPSPPFVEPSLVDSPISGGPLAPVLRSVAWRPDPDLSDGYQGIALIAGDRGALLMYPKNGNSAHVFQYPSPLRPDYYHIALSPRNGSMWTGLVVGERGIIQVIDGYSVRPPLTWECGMALPDLRGVSFNSDSSSLVVGTRGTVLNVNILGGEVDLVTTDLYLDLNYVTTRPGGTEALIVGDGGTILLSEENAEQRFLSFSGAEGYLLSASWHPEGRHALVVGTPILIPMPVPPLPILINVSMPPRLQLRSLDSLTLAPLLSQTFPFSSLTPFYEWHISVEFHIPGPDHPTMNITVVPGASGQPAVLVDRAVLYRTREPAEIATEANTTAVNTSLFGPNLSGSNLTALSPPLSSPSVTPKRIVFADNDGRVTGITVSNISCGWVSEATVGESVVLKLADEVVYVGTDTGRVLALYVNNGSVIWESSLSGGVLFPPAVVGNRLILTSKNGLSALSIVNGTFLWDTITANPGSMPFDATSSPGVLPGQATDGGRIFTPVFVAPLGFHKMRTYRVTDGTFVWTSSLPAQVTHPPLLTDGLLIAVTGSRDIIAMNIEDGSSVWNAKLDAPPSGSPAISDRAVVLASTGGKVTALDVADGRMLWRTNLNSSLITSPVVTRNLAFVGTADGRLVALSISGPSGGLAVWNVSIGTNSTSPAIADLDTDGHFELIATDDAGNVLLVNGAGVSSRNEILWAGPHRTNTNQGGALFVPPYQPTDPMEDDSDGDDVLDSEETGPFWGLDRLEIEDFCDRTSAFSWPFEPIFTQSSIRLNVARRQFRANLTVRDPLNTSKFESWLVLKANLSRPGLYHIVLEGSGTIGFADPSRPPSLPPKEVEPSEELVLWEKENEILKTAVNVAISRDPISTTFALPLIPPLEEERAIHFSRGGVINTGEGYLSTIVRSWHYGALLELGSGSYALNISLNTSSFFAGSIQTPYGAYVVSLMEISSDFLTIEEASYGRLRADQDRDYLLDGVELANEMFPLSPDADEDGLSDMIELNLGTEPLERDSDRDGARDRVEMGLGLRETDPHTVWDTASASNSDKNPSTTTDNLDVDSDGDGLPDGAVEGWGMDTWQLERGRERWGRDYGITDWNNDWTPHGWEGEDLNGDGAVGFVGSGESDPGATFSDGDSMPDWWEKWHLLDALSDLRPNGNGGDMDVTVTFDPNHTVTTPWEHILLGNSQCLMPAHDGLTNKYEYLTWQSPWAPDGDGDGLQDGGEIPVGIASFPVVFRTNVEEGGFRFSHYGEQGMMGYYEWIWIEGREYGFAYVAPDADYTHWAAPDKNLFSGHLPSNVNFVGFLRFGGVVLEAKNQSYAFVWRPRSIELPIFYSTWMRKEVVIYSRAASQGRAPASAYPLPGYREEQLYFSDPFRSDTDRDGKRDDMELKYIPGTGFPDTNHISQQDPRDYDADNDKWANSRDIDSDNDGIHDSWEAFEEVGSYTALVGRPNPYNADTDGDSIDDGMDEEPLDADNDGLTGYDSFINIFGDWAAFHVGSLETSHSTDPNDHDTDGDGLYDGDEIFPATFDKDGIESSFVTDPTNPDTDGDGLTDLQEVESYYRSNPTLEDTDGDGLPDGWVDSNSDTVADGWEGEDLNLNGKKDSDETHPRLFDTDRGGASDGAEQEWNRKGKTPTLDPVGNKHDDFHAADDDDGDGLPDSWEEHHFGDLKEKPGGDPDGDGLTNLEEFENGTDPNDSDTDGDEMPDKWEIDHGFNPISPVDASFDPDLDMLANKHEYHAKTDPLDPDTDDDGLPDGCININFNTMCESTLGEFGEFSGETSPPSGGQLAKFLTSPLDPDTDGDGLSDFTEMVYYKTKGYDSNSPGTEISIDDQQEWKKTDLLFTRSVGKTVRIGFGEGATRPALTFNEGFSWDPGFDVAGCGLSGSIAGNVAFKAEIYIDVTVNLDFRFEVEHESWYNKYATLEGDIFPYLSRVNPGKLTVTASFGFEPHLDYTLTVSMSGDAEVSCGKVGYTVFDKSFSRSKSTGDGTIPDWFLLFPQYFDFNRKLEAPGIMTPIGESFKSPWLEAVAHLPSGYGPIDLPFGLGYVSASYEFFAYAAAQFKVLGKVLADVVEMVPGENPTTTNVTYEEAGGIVQVDVEVPAYSAGDIMELLTKNFTYVLEPRIAYMWDFGVEVGADLHIDIPDISVWETPDIDKSISTPDWTHQTKTDFFSLGDYEIAEAAEDVVDTIDIIDGQRIPLDASNKNILEYTEFAETYTFGAFTITPSAGIIADLTLEGQLYAHTEPSNRPWNPLVSYLTTDGGLGREGYLNFGDSFAAITIAVDLPPIQLGRYELIPQADLTVEWRITLEEAIPTLTRTITIPPVFVRYKVYSLTTPELEFVDTEAFDYAEYLSGEIRAGIWIPKTANMLLLELRWETMVTDKAEITGALAFPSEWETAPYVDFLAVFVVGICDLSLTYCVQTRYTELNAQFIIKGRGVLDANFLAQGAQDYAGTTMRWENAGDIRDAYLYPELDRDGSPLQNVTASLGDITYTLTLVPTLRIVCKLLDWVLLDRDYEIMEVPASPYNTNPDSVEVSM